MNLPMGGLQRMGREICQTKALATRKEVLAVPELKRPDIPVIAQTPQQFEVYVAYEWRACDEFERINTAMTPKLAACIVQEVARRADVERGRAKRSSTIPSPSPLAENRRLLTPATGTSDFRNYHYWMARIRRTPGRKWRHKRRSGGGKGGDEKTGG